MRRTPAVFVAIGFSALVGVALIEGHWMAMSLAALAVGGVIWSARGEA